MLAATNAATTPTPIKTLIRVSPFRISNVKTSAKGIERTTNLSHSSSPLRVYPPKKTLHQREGSLTWPMSSSPLTDGSTRGPTSSTCRSAVKARGVGHFARSARLQGACTPDLRQRRRARGEEPYRKGDLETRGGPRDRAEHPFHTSRGSGGRGSLGSALHLSDSRKSHPSVQDLVTSVSCRHPIPTQNHDSVPVNSDTHMNRSSTSVDIAESRGGD